MTVIAVTPLVKRHGLILFPRTHGRAAHRAVASRTNAPSGPTIAARGASHWKNGTPVPASTSAP